MTPEPQGPFTAQLKNGCRRLRDVNEILSRLSPRFGSLVTACAWYRSAPLAGFGGRTAIQLVREGEAREVLACVEAVDAGVFV